MKLTSKESFIVISLDGKNGGIKSSNSDPCTDSFVTMKLFSCSKVSKVLCRRFF